MSLVSTENDVDSTAHVAAVRRQPMLIVAHHPEPAQVGGFAILRHDTTLSIARGAEPFGVALEDAKLSRQHLEISRRGDAVIAKDVGSRNGSQLNGAPLTSPTELSDGDVIGAGQLLVVFRRGPVFHRRPEHDVLIGISPALAELLEEVGRASEQEGTVLIQGETGVGKELTARTIHRARRPGKPFVAVNCGAIADTVLQSELFGHVRGAYSGADDARDGLVLSARGGTLFLDEIGDASSAFQVSLLRLLETGEYRPVGSDATQHSDATIIAASHVPLSEAVESGRFRRDLLGRLMQCTLEVPPLRVRGEDAAVLTAHFAKERVGRELSLSRAFALALMRHDWRANVREVQAVVHQALIDMGDDNLLHMSERVAAMLDRPATVNRPRAERVGEVPTADALRDLFVAHRGNMKAIAEQLGVGRNTLYRWFKSAGHDVQALRDALS